MGIVSSEIVEDATQHDGRRWVRYLYTWAEGIQRTYGPRLVPSDFDAAADMAAQVSGMEAREKRRELNQVDERVFVQGENPKTLPLVLNTRDEALTFVLKRMANADELDAARYARLAGLFTDSEIATLLGVLEVDATDWRSKLAALDTSIKDYDHSLPDYEDVR